MLQLPNLVGTAEMVNATEIDIVCPSKPKIVQVFESGCIVEVSVEYSNGIIAVRSLSPITATINYII